MEKGDEDDEATISDSTWQTMRTQLTSTSEVALIDYLLQYFKHRDINIQYRMSLAF